MKQPSIMGWDGGACLAWRSEAEGGGVVELQVDHEGMCWYLLPATGMPQEFDVPIPGAIAVALGLAKKSEKTAAKNEGESA